MTIVTQGMRPAQSLVSLSAELATNPYRAVELYREAGWLGTLPVPYRKKTFPPSGFTGEHGAFPTDDQCRRWLADEYRSANIALRVPHGVIGVDVDQYTKDGVEKLGADNLRAMAEKEGLSWPLPSTWTSTRRDADSPARIRFYRVPVGVKFEDPVPDVEVIQHSHRYAVVWPSVAPDGDEWTQYAWYDPTGAEADHIPSPDDLATLPPEWVDALREHEFGGGTSGSSDRRSTRGLAELLAVPADAPNDRNNRWLAQVAGHLARLHEDDRDAYWSRLHEADQASRYPHKAADFRKTANSIWRMHQKNRKETAVTDNKLPQRYEIPLKDGASNIRNLREALNQRAIPDLFVQNGRLVKVHDLYGNAELPHGESLKAIAPLTNEGLGNEMADHVLFYQEVEGEDGKRYKQPKQPRQEVLRVVLGNRSWPGVPALRGITRVPILRTDGTVLTDPGYDAASGMYFDPMCGFDAVPDRPSRSEIDYAFDFVYNQVLGNFPYKEQSDRANAFAYATHHTGRRFLEGASDGGVQPTPGANVVAGSQGTGKTYLASVPLWTSGVLASAGMTDYRPDEAELSKTVISSLYNKRSPVIVLDNVPDGYLVKNTTLAYFLTRGNPEARVLGQTKNIHMVNDVMWALTGNGTRLSDDMRRRFFDVRLDAGVANPAMRDNFALGDLERYFNRSRQHKAKFIWCCLVLWRAWIVDGAKEATCRMRGSYSWWAAPTAGLLEFLGVEGFMENYDPGASAEAERWVPFLTAWEAKYGTTRLKVSGLMRGHVDNGEMDGWEGSFILPTNVNDHKAVREAGDILASKVDKVWNGGLVLRKASRSGSNSYWVERRS